MGWNGKVAVRLSDGLKGLHPGEAEVGGDSRDGRGIDAPHIG